MRQPDEIFGGVSDATPDPAMISIAQKIIEQQEGPFDPSQFVDRYEEALKALIEAKTKGRQIAKVAEPEDTNVVDLMSALRASLGARENRPDKPTTRAKPAKGSAKARPRKTG